MSQATLMASGGMRVTYADLKALPDPVSTPTHHPVAFHVLDDIVQHRIRKEFGSSICIEPEYALSGNKAQFFGVYGIRSGHGVAAPGLYPAVAMKSSINKSLQPAIAGGAKVWACANTCIWGDLLEACRRQTAYSMEDIEMMIVRIMSRLESHFHSAEQDVEVMQDMEVTDTKGFGVIGELFGTSVLTVGQMTRAFKAWKKPEYEEFKPRTAWSLYNSVTEGLKKGQPGHAMGRYTRLHQDFNRRYVTGFSQRPENVRSHDDELIERER